MYTVIFDLKWPMFDLWEAITCVEARKQFYEWDDVNIKTSQGHLNHTCKPYIYFMTLEHVQTFLSWEEKIVKSTIFNKLV